MEFLTTDDIERLHELIIRRYGGASLALRDFGALDSAVAAPQQIVFETELYPTIEEKAAIIFFLLIQNHPFVDGNKRTAVASLERFLDMNGSRLIATDDELFELTLSIATGEYRKEEIAVWLRDRISSIQS